MMFAARLVSLYLAMLMVTFASGAEWLQFRGVNGSGFAPDSAYPTDWSDANNLAWETVIPGGGWSSPVVSGDRVYVTTAVSPEAGKPKGFGAGVASMRAFARAKTPEQPMSFELHCLSLASGEPLWKQVVASQTPPHKIHPSNSYATESPATDGERVFVYFAAIGVVACFDLAGQETWRRELGAYPTSNDFGTGSSLAVTGGLLFVQCDNQEDSFICALDASSGDERWRKTRDSNTSWSSPVVWKNRNRTELVVCGTGSVISYDPETGSVIWWLSGTGGAFSSSPTNDSDRIYLGNSGRTSRGPLVAVDAKAEGELSLESTAGDGVAWVEDTSAPGMASPVAVAGKVFVLSRGILNCHDATTGKRLYRNRLPKASSVAASLWASDEHLFVLDESGRTFVIATDGDFSIAETNTLAGLFWSTPAVAGDSLLVRSADKLYCIRAASREAD